MFNPIVCNTSSNILIKLALSFRSCMLLKRTTEKSLYFYKMKRNFLDEASKNRKEKKKALTMLCADVKKKKKLACSHSIMQVNNKIETNVSCAPLCISTKLGGINS